MGHEGEIDEYTHHEKVKRHFYTCGDATLSWSEAWYTEPFFTSYRTSYDSVASTGPVNPPATILNTISECSAAIFSASRTSLPSSPSLVTTTSSRKGSTTTINTAISSPTITIPTSILPSPSGSQDLITSAVDVTSTPSTGHVIISSVVSVFTLSPASVIPSTSTAKAISTTTTTSTPTATITTGLEGANNVESWSQTVCAGGWDWQAWGTIGALLIGVLLGVLIWMVWGLLRGRMPGFYSGRTWFLSPSSRPSGTVAFLTFFVPFLHLPSLSSSTDQPLSEGDISVHLLFSALRLAAIASLVALAAGLPLYLAKTPCLAETSPPNPLGGRLGTLNDMSLLRLLNSLDPSPDTTSSSELRRLTNRSLPSTVIPAIPNARARLVVLLVLMVVILIGHGIWIVNRTYTALMRYKATFDDAICQGQQMVWICAEDAIGWKAQGEEGVKDCLRTLGLSGSNVAPGPTGEGGNDREKDANQKNETKVDVVGVFAISRAYPQLAVKVEERKIVLRQLEVAETNYIRSFCLIHTPSNSGKVRPVATGNGKDLAQPVSQSSQNIRPPADYVAPRSFYKISGHAVIDETEGTVTSARPSKTGPLVEIIPPSRSATGDTGLAQTTGQRVIGSRFIELNRDSALYGGKRFQIGQRVRIGEDGVLIAESCSESSKGTDEPSEESASRPTGDQSPGAEVLSPVDISASAAGPSGTSGHSNEITSPLRPDAVSLAPAEARLPARSLSWPRQIISPKTLNRSGSYVIVPLENPDVVADTSQNEVATRSPSLNASNLAETYHSIGRLRTHLKDLNYEIHEMQQATFTKMAAGESIMGWILVGKGVSFLPFAQELGRTREDILWGNLGVESRGERGEIALRGRRKKDVQLSIALFWMGVLGVGLILSLLVVPVAALTVASAPGLAHYLGLMQPIAKSDGFGAGFTEGVVPSIILSISVALAIAATNLLSKRVRVPSYTHRTMLAYQATFWLLFWVVIIWILLVASLEFSVQAFSNNIQKSRSVGDGSIFSTWAIFVTLLNISVIVPALTVLQPKRLLGYLRNRGNTVTPRQRFLLNYPPSYNPSYALAGAIVAVFYATTLIMIFPLLAIPIVLLLYLSLIANSYMIHYVCVESKGAPSDGRLALWTIRRFGWTLGVQPFLFGLILLSRQEWGIGGAGLGLGILVVALVEALTVYRHPRSTHHDISTRQKQSLTKLQQTLCTPPSNTSISTPRPSTTSILGIGGSGGGGMLSSSPRQKRRRRSNASILEMIHTLLPGVSRLPPTGPLPLELDGIDCYTFPERAAYARPERPERPPRHPPLSFGADPSANQSQARAQLQRRQLDPVVSGPERILGPDSTDEVDPSKGLIYPPELLAVQPLIWLADDEAGIARAEIADLQVHHRLEGIVDPADEILRRRKRMGS